MKNFLKFTIIGIITIAAIISGILLLSQNAEAARTQSSWVFDSSGYIFPVNPADVLIQGVNKYLNFGTFSGASGYGIRDNAGTMEFKNSLGNWTGIGTGGGGGGGGSVGTSSQPVKGQIPYWTTDTASPALLGSVASSSLTISSPLTTSGTPGALVGGTNLSIGCQIASGSQDGCLSSANWTTFNNKVSSQWVDGGSGKLYYTGGNVGIGTTNPTAALTFPAASTGIVLHNQADQTTNTETGFARWSGNSFQIGTDKAGTGTARGLEFFTGGVSRFTLTGAGDYSPTADNTLFLGLSSKRFYTGYFSNSLNIGTGASPQVYFAASGNSWLNGGNVGIGTTSPSKKLSVQGDSYFSGDLTLANLTATGTIKMASVANDLKMSADNTYDIGASAASRPRNVYIAGNTVIGGQTTLATSLTGLLYGVSGVVTASSSLQFDTTNGDVVIGGAGLKGALHLKPANTAYNWYTLKNDDNGANEGLTVGKGAYPANTDLVNISPGALVTSLGAGAGFKAFNTGVAGVTFNTAGVSSFYTSHNLNISGSGSVNFQTYSGSWLTRATVANDGKFYVGTSTVHNAGMTLANGDLYVATSTGAVSGVVLQSANGTCHRLVVSDADVITSSTVTCP